MAGPELSRLGGFVINTKKFYDKYMDIKREFVTEVDKAEKFENVPEKYVDIINDCLDGSGRTLQDFGIVD